MEGRKCTYFFCRECSDLGVGGWVSTNPNIGFVNPYELLDAPSNMVSFDSFGDPSNYGGGLIRRAPLLGRIRYL